MLLSVVLWALSLILYGRHTDCNETHARVQAWLNNQTARQCDDFTHSPKHSDTRLNNIHLPLIVAGPVPQVIMTGYILTRSYTLVVLSRICAAQNVCRSHIVYGLTNIPSPYSVSVLSFETFVSFVFFRVFASSWQAAVTCFYSAKSNLCPHLFQSFPTR